MKETHKTKKMKPSICIDRMLHRSANDFRLVKGFLADTLVDADNVLPHYSSSTNIQMSIIWSFN
jgi:hypothetical protein